jgi:hypothetical protein
MRSNGQAARHAGQASRAALPSLQMSDDRFEADEVQETLGEEGLDQSGDAGTPQGAPRRKRSWLDRLLGRGEKTPRGPYTAADQYLDNVARDAAGDFGEHKPPEI